MLREFHSPEDYLRDRQQRGSVETEIQERVRAIIQQVEDTGDRALRELTERFDGVLVDALRVPAKVLQREMTNLSPDIKNIFLKAISNVQLFHNNQKPESWLSEKKDGSRLGMQFSAIERVGCYIPGGTAGYPSTVIMTVVPAQAAGVAEIVLVSPPDKTGRVNPYVLAVAGLLGVEEVYAVGGAQAVAALALGTETIRRVDKIVGPGNAYVNEAKRQLFGTVGIDSLAGPTEVVVFADASANPQFVTKDLLAQAEHDTAARAVLITNSQDLAAKVQKLCDRMVATAARKETLEVALRECGAIVFVDSMSAGTRLINEIAPEHVQIMTHDPEAVVREIKNAGALCVGPHTPAAVGDYLAGPNHVLPTAGTARFSSPLSVYDFVKFSSVLRFSEKRLLNDCDKIAQFAELEGLPNHKESVLCRKR